MPDNTEKVSHAYKSKHNLSRENKVIHLMKGKAMVKTPLFCCKKSSALLRGIISEHDGDFYCLNCFHSFKIENKLKKNMKMCVKSMIIVM